MGNKVGGVVGVMLSIVIVSIIGVLDRWKEGRMILGGVSEWLL